MPNFMQHAKESIDEIIFVVARGHATIAWAPAAVERVDGHIQPAGAKVKANLGGGLAGKASLGIGRVAAVHDVDGGSPAGRDNPTDQINQGIQQLGKNMLEILGRLIWL